MKMQSWTGQEKKWGFGGLNAEMNLIVMLHIVQTYLLFRKGYTYTINFDIIFPNCVNLEDLSAEQRSLRENIK